MKTQNFKKVMVLLLLLAQSSSVALASTTYTPSSQREQIAYLQGVLDALRSQLLANAGNSSRVETDTPQFKSEVTLSATYDIGSQSYVYAWFEYGIGSLSKKTTRTKINKDRGDDEVTHRRTITSLEEDTVYSYRAVFETRNGDRSYGAVGTFKTDGTVSSADSYPTTGSTVSNSRGSISINQTTYEPGETIEVEWTLPRSKKDSTNWIGLFKTSASNQNYLNWSYLANDDEGTVSFTAPAEGNYEIRLFYKNTYDDEVTSRRITVTD